MLDSATIKKINDFVHQKPRTIQEVAELLGKNWRTADRYVEQIAKETGSISTRTFREGTRGALKIAHWSHIERIHSQEFQERLLQKIESSRKMEFSPFDIYQHVEEGKRNAVMMTAENYAYKDYVKPFLERAQNQILSFSGNLSWINAAEENRNIIDVIEALAKNNISVKILSRVTIDSMKNVQKILSINEKIGKNMIEIRHREQPLRGFVIDTHMARFRESRDPSDYEKGELDERVLLFYEIFDPEWIEWFQKVFWYFFRTAIPAEKRIKDLQSIHNVYRVG
ncbi:MAG: hypothetical protein HY367_03855 [Candidatus Aenigmarchaeota archaeon]|nr:hypothetical protein [Candidatus Aenigmarchaeota archaeon]